MNSLPTRFFCATLSVIGAAGLVAFASPAVAVGATTSKAPTSLIAAAPVGLARNV